MPAGFWRRPDAAANQFASRPLGRCRLGSTRAACNVRRVSRVSHARLFFHAARCARAQCAANVDADDDDDGGDDGDDGDVDDDCRLRAVPTGTTNSLNSGRPLNCASAGAALLAAELRRATQFAPSGAPRLSATRVCFIITPATPRETEARQRGRTIKSLATLNIGLGDFAALLVGIAAKSPAAAQ